MKAFDVSEVERAEFIRIARANYNDDGSIEIDDDAVVSTTEETRAEGGYVQAWAWVSLRDENSFGDCEGSSVTHTPGPWESRRSGRIVAGNLSAEDSRAYVATVHGDAISSLLTGEDEANARLIAAAPDLLAACIAAVEIPWRSDVGKQLRAAIAKAEGTT